MIRTRKPTAGVRRGGVNTTHNQETYADKILTIDPTNQIQFLKLNETSGTNAVDYSPEANNATYNAGVTLNASTFLTGDPVPRWDGTGDVLNIYSAGLAADFDFLEFTLAGWMRVFASGVWTDGVDRRFFTILVDGSNFIFLRKATTNNSINMVYNAGGTLKQVQTGSQTSTDWIHVALTVSKSNDRLRSYINGVQVGATQTGLGVWAGAMSSSSTVIGGNVTGATANIWDGWLAYPTVWKSELSPAQIAALAVV